MKMGCRSKSILSIDDLSEYSISAEFKFLTIFQINSTVGLNSTDMGDKTSVGER